MTFKNKELLDKILFCPVTRMPLQLEENDSTHFLTSGKYRYAVKNGIVNMIPKDPPPSLAGKWEIWQQLQKNAIIPYQLAPQLNLARKGNTATEAFKSFINIKDHPLLLDVGCGPQKGMPAYISSGFQGTYVGVDPINGDDDRQFVFVQGIGEAMPFQDHSFDHVLFHSSLDHMLDFRITIQEAYRVLNPDGRVSICSDFIDLDPSLTDQNRFVRVVDILKKAIKQISKGIQLMGIMPTIGYVLSMMNLKVPDGAIDFFHMHFPRKEELVSAMTDFGFKEIDTRIFQNQLFINAVKKRAVILDE